MGTGWEEAGEEEGASRREARVYGWYAAARWGWKREGVAGVVIVLIGEGFIVIDLELTGRGVSRGGEEGREGEGCGLRAGLRVEECGEVVVGMVRQGKAEQEDCIQGAKVELVITMEMQARTKGGCRRGGRRPGLAGFVAMAVSLVVVAAAAAVDCIMMRRGGGAGME